MSTTKSSGAVGLQRAINRCTPPRHDRHQSLRSCRDGTPSADLAEFRRWFTEFDRARWDREIEQDMAADKLDAFLAEAQADYLVGDSARAL